MSDEHEFEPVHGLPQALPPGERILWQGEPAPRALARSVFFGRALSVYFAVVIVWQSLGVVTDGGDLRSVAGAVFGTAVLGLLALGLGQLFARLYARTTVYTITNRRVVLRFGLALPLNVNLPFTVIRAAAMNAARDGSGDIALTLEGDQRVGYVHMWPCVQRWHFSHPRPSLRAIPDVAAVAAILAAALEAAPQAAPGARGSAELAAPRNPWVVA